MSLSVRFKLRGNEKKYALAFANHVGLELSEIARRCLLKLISDSIVREPQEGTDELGTKDTKSTDTAGIISDDEHPISSTPHGGSEQG